MHFADPQGVGDSPFMTVESPGRFWALNRFDLLVLIIDAQVPATAPLAQDVPLG